MDNNYYRSVSWTSTGDYDLDFEDGVGCDLMMTLANKIEALQLYCEGHDCAYVNHEGNRPKCCFDGDEFKWCHYVLKELNDHEQVVNDAFSKAYPSSVTTKNNVDHPNHYNRPDSIECIDEMMLIFGREATKNFCLLNVWKYRYRAADKNGVEDLKKSDWYMRKYKELCEYERVPIQDICGLPRERGL